MTLALIFAAVDRPDDVGDHHANGLVAQRALDEAVIMAERYRQWVERLRSTHSLEANTAFNSIVDEYNDRLIRFAYGFVKSADPAHDLVQDVFLRVWERRATIRSEESLRGYLFTSVRRAALNFLKHQTVELRYASNALHEVSSSSTLTIDDQLELDAIAHAVRTALGKLSERRRTALHLRYEEQLPFTVIAEVMGLSEDATQHLVRRALKELREQLGV
jgi:RNA polymerase sigma-70 factor (ECF subfamily)